MKNKLIATLILTIASLALMANNWQQSVHHYSVADGLPQNLVMDIIEDRDGFLWISTWDGICRFDGYEFKTYKPSFSAARVATNRIDYLYEDQLGFIWMRGYDGSFYRLNKHTEQILATDIQDTRFGNRLPITNLLLEQSPGVIWLSGDEHLLRVEETTKQGKTDETKQTLYELRGDANFLLCDGDGLLWAGTSHGIECFADERQTFMPGSNDAENDFTAGLADGQNLWLGTEEGVVWHYTSKNNRFERVRLGLHSAITGLAVLDNNHLIITTQEDGFVVYNRYSGESKLFSSATSKEITSNTFDPPYVDKQGVAWLINRQLGVWRYDRQSHNLRRYVPEIDPRYQGQLLSFFFAFEDAEGHVWLNPNGGGLSYYDDATDQLLSPLGGCTNMVHAAYMDKSGSLWLGTYDLGLDRVDVSRERFHFRELHQSPLQPGEVRSICQLQSGEVLMAVKDKSVHRYKDGIEIGMEMMPERVYTMLEQADGKVWYGTRGKGLLLKNGQQTSTFIHDEKDPKSLSCNDIYDLLYTPDSLLFVATYGGGINILQNGEFLHQGNDWATYPDNFGSKVRQLMLLNDTILWAATTSGLLCINTRTLHTHASPYFDIRTIAKASDGRVWLGTFGGGLLEVLDPTQEDVLADSNIRQYTSRTGLLSDIVLSMVAMPDGDLWFAYEEGLSHYNNQTQTFQHFNVLLHERYSFFGEANGILLDNGEVLFGYTHGFCWFNPQEIFLNRDLPQIQFTDFLLGNKNIVTSEEGRHCDNVNYTNRVTLNHDQNVFTICYAAMDYAAAEHIVYAYRMDGVDDDWNYVGHARKATYTMMKAGDYTFRVRSTNADGVWGDNERTIAIHIRPSFWATPYAWAIYLVMLFVLLWILVHNFRTGNQLRQEMAVEQKVTDIKLRFFTNISHELRTPLTLITGPVENLLRNETLSPSVRTQLEIVSSNASRMLRLINHILDFRKIQNQKMRLRVQESNLNQLAENTFGNFTKEAADKHVNFTFEAPEEPILAWVDRERVDTIIYNLLSNAFKFTPSGKSITLRVKDTHDYAIVEVSDTGIGIPKDKRAVLFERFASHNEINAQYNKQGTGIGLNLVKELVDLHHGYIEVDSEPGKGTTFQIMFQHGRDHFRQDAEIIYGDENSPVEADATAKTEGESEPIQDPNRKTVLIVDDNDDMRVFLQSILSADYNVLSAADGVEALSISEKHILDLVVTDLMMPNMDGLELTQYLKSNMQTSHIPVLLLTAKSAIESRLQALKYGADDYITKPFSPEYLLARIDNIVRQRERLQENYRRMLITKEAPAEGVVKSPNDIFLEKLYAFMMKNLDNNALTVDDMVHEMALGRTVFFNKLKSLTGLSPVEYIRDVRIKHAAEMLLNPKYNITEVTYMVGMNDSRYFAKCFKAVYGITPTEYKRKNGRKDDNQSAPDTSN